MVCYTRGCNGDQPTATGLDSLATTTHCSLGPRARACRGSAADAPARSAAADADRTAWHGQDQAPTAESGCAVHPRLAAGLAAGASRRQPKSTRRESSRAGFATSSMRLLPTEAARTWGRCARRASTTEFLRSSPRTKPGNAPEPQVRSGRVSPCRSSVPSDSRAGPGDTRSRLGGVNLRLERDYRRRRPPAPVDSPPGPERASRRRLREHRGMGSPIPRSSRR